MTVDIEVVKLAKNGDEQSFALIYDNVATDLYKFALYTLGNAYDAEDVVSETFIEAYKGIKNLREETSFKPWIMRILSIRCKRKIASYIQDKNNLDIESFIDTSFDVAPADSDCSDKITVITALGKLEDTERQIITLSVVQGYTTREVAEMLDLPQGTVSSKLYRGLAKMRKDLEKQ